MAHVSLNTLGWFYIAPYISVPCTSSCFVKPADELTRFQFTNYWTGIFFPMFIKALILAMVYTVTQDQRGMKASFYFITIPAQLTPYAMMLVTFLMAGPMPTVLQLHGLVAAHLYDFLTRIWPEFGGGRNLIPAPAFLSRLVETPRVFRRDYGTAIRPSGQSSGSSTGASTGPLPDSWRTRGSGHRLG